MRRLPALLVLPVLLLPVGCGSDSSGDSSADGSGEESSSGEIFSGVEISGEPGEAPKVAIDDPPFEVKETQTEVLSEGDGAEVKAGDQALVQYLGVSGESGEEFDSSWSRGGKPVTFPLDQGGLIPGFLDGLIGQTYGSQVAIAIPPADGYGDQGVPEAGIAPGASLVFVVDLLEAAPAPLSMAEGTAQDLPAGLPALDTDKQGVPSGFTSDGDTESSVDELVVAPVIIGDGAELEEGQTATVHYVGQLYPDGKVFDESWSRGQPAQFPLTPGGLIQGFLDGLIGQPIGSRVVLAIPSDQGYGKTGNPPAIPPNSDLIFVVDILGAS